VPLVATMVAEPTPCPVTVAVSPEPNTSATAALRLVHATAGFGTGLPLLSPTGEFSVSGGGSRYADFASSWHAIGEACMHLVVPGRGAWLSAAAGRTSYGSSPRPIAVTEIGGWTRQGSLMLTALASRSFKGDTVYSDVASTGSVAGRYLTAGVRLRTATLRRHAARDPTALGRPPAGADGDPLSGPQLEMESSSDGGIRLRLHVPPLRTA
jgi:hypothetical protein